MKAQASAYTERQKRAPNYFDWEKVSAQLAESADKQVFSFGLVFHLLQEPSWFSAVIYLAIYHPVVISGLFAVALGKNICAVAMPRGLLKHDAL